MNSEHNIAWHTLAPLQMRFISCRTVFAAYSIKTHTQCVIDALTYIVSTYDCYFSSSTYFVSFIYVFICFIDCWACKCACIRVLLECCIVFFSSFEKKTANMSLTKWCSEETKETHHLHPIGIGCDKDNDDSPLHHVPLFVCLFGRFVLFYFRFFVFECVRIFPSFLLSLWFYYTYLWQ